MKQEIGNNLKMLRKREGLTLAALSEASGVDTGNLSKIERGLIEPSIGTLSKLAAALEVPMGALFNEIPSSRIGQIPWIEGATETYKRFLSKNDLDFEEVFFLQWVLQVADDESRQSDELWTAALSFFREGPARKLLILAMMASHRDPEYLDVLLKAFHELFGFTLKKNFPPEAQDWRFVAAGVSTGTPTYWLEYRDDPETQRRFVINVWDGVGSAERAQKLAAEVASHKWVRERALALERVGKDHAFEVPVDDSEDFPVLVWRKT